jgi:hypothetical protein
MMTKIMYSTIVLGLAATVASAGEVLINDFEKAPVAAFAYDHNSWDGSGSIANEKDAEGNYVIQLAEAAAGESNYGLGAVVEEGSVGFTIGLIVENMDNCVDIKYDYKGTAHKLAIVSEDDDQNNGYFHYSERIEESEDWTEGTVVLSQTKRTNQNNKNNLNSAEIIQLRWDVSRGEAPRHLYVDNVRCSTLEGFEISFMNGETLLQTKIVPEGEMPEYTGATPQKESSEEYDYFFKGWTPELVEATEDAS